jgi:hypothetical protein
MMNDTLMNAINEVANLPDKDKVNIKGKFYTTVASRVSIFRKHFGSHAKLMTELVMHDLDRVVVKATVSVKTDGEFVEIGTGYAEEWRGAGMINKTSALENCDTSALGRALSACGMGGSEYASSFEVDNAIHNKSERPAPVDGKHKLFAADGETVISHTDDPDDFLTICRKHIGDPTSEAHQKIYAASKWMIKSAMQSSRKKETKESFVKMIEAYEIHE